MKFRSCRHDQSEPITYFDVEDTTLGIRYEAATSFRFRMRPAVARAWADGDRAALRPAER